MDGPLEEPRYYFRLDAFSPQLAKIVFSKKFMKNLDRRQALGNERSEGVLRDKLCHLVLHLSKQYQYYSINVSDNTLAM